MEWVKCIPTKLEKNNDRFSKNNDKSNGNPPKNIIKKIGKKKLSKFQPLILYENNES